MSGNSCIFQREKVYADYLDVLGIIIRMYFLMINNTEFHMFMPNVQVFVRFSVS